MLQWVMFRKLSSEERQQLQIEHRKQHNGKVRDRIKAVLAYDEGYNYVDIAAILLLDDETIRRHVEDYFSKNKLAPENGGSMRLLSEAQQLDLISHLRATTYLTVKRICYYVKKTFGIRYSISGMHKWLKQVGFRYKKPHAIPAKVNVGLQHAFIAQYRKLSKKSSRIYFVDSVHPQHQMRAKHGWIYKGELKQIRNNARRKHLNIIGGIELSGHKFIHSIVDKVNAESISCFLKKLRKQNKDDNEINVIWDNAGYHKERSIAKIAHSLKIKLGTCTK